MRSVDALIAARTRQAPAAGAAIRR